MKFYRNQPQVPHQRPPRDRQNVRQNVKRIYTHNTVFRHLNSKNNRGKCEAKCGESEETEETEERDNIRSLLKEAK
eukprot:SAG22_NODE_44_length_24912_cov_33.648894_7_plen_76_part_00